MQRRVLGEGAVSSAFIPVFSETLTQKGKQAAQQLTANIFIILLILLSTVSFALFLFSLRSCLSQNSGPISCFFKLSLIYRLVKGPAGHFCPHPTKVVA